MGLGLGLCCCDGLCDPVESVFETFDSVETVDPSISIKRNPYPYVYAATPYTDWTVNAGRLEALWKDSYNSGVAVVRPNAIDDQSQHTIEWNSEFDASVISANHSRLIRFTLYGRDQFDNYYVNLVRVDHSAIKSPDGSSVEYKVFLDSTQIFSSPSSAHDFRLVVTDSDAVVYVDGALWTTVAFPHRGQFCTDYLAIELSGAYRGGLGSPSGPVVPTGCYLDWLKVS